MQASILAVILWVTFTVILVFQMKHYAIKQSGVSPRTFWKFGLAGYVRACAGISALVMLAIYAFTKVIA